MTVLGYSDLADQAEVLWSTWNIVANADEDFCKYARSAPV